MDSTMEKIQELEVSIIERMEEIETIEEEISNLSADIKRLEKCAKYDEAAEELKMIHDSYVRAGFTEDQAVAILAAILSSARPR